MRKGYIVKGYVHDVEDGTLNDIVIAVYTTLDKARREIRRAESCNNARKQALSNGKEPYELYYTLWISEIDII
jgi:hypothetical protein